MAIRHYRITDKATDRFPAMKDSEADVVNVSGAPSPNTILLPRMGATDDHPGDSRKSARRQVEVNAQTSESYDASMARGLSAAARRQLQFGRAVEGAGPSEKPMLRHLFGLNLPGR
jgi:hypothetical protein